MNDRLNHVFAELDTGDEAVGVQCPFRQLRLLLLLPFFFLFFLLQQLHITVVFCRN